MCIRDRCRGLKRIREDRTLLRVEKRRKLPTEGPDSCQFYQLLHVLGANVMLTAGFEKSKKRDEKKGR